VTSLVSEATREVARSAGSDRLAVEPALIVIAVLTVLLVEREVVRASRAPGTAPRWRSLDIVIGPLLVAFGLIVATRLQDLLP
jgi:hypothetical protein